MYVLAESPTAFPSKSAMFAKSICELAAATAAAASVVAVAMSMEITYDDQDLDQDLVERKDMRENRCVLFQ